MEGFEATRQAPSQKTEKTALNAEANTQEKPSISARVKKNLIVAKNKIVYSITQFFNKKKSQPQDPEQEIQEIAAMSEVPVTENSQDTGLKKDDDSIPKKPAGKKYISKNLVKAALVAGAVATGGTVIASEASADSFNAFNSALPGVSAATEGSGITHNLQQVSVHEPGTKSYAAPRMETPGDVANAVEKLGVDHSLDSGREVLKKGLGEVTAHLGQTTGAVVKILGDSLIAGAAGRVEDKAGILLRGQLDQAMAKAGVSEAARYSLSDRDPHNMDINHTFKIGEKGSLTFGAHDLMGGGDPTVSVNFKTTW